jgi:hypothetical protein
MAKAAKDAGLTVNGTVKEMMKLQQTGGLISSKVLPHFAKRMSEAARANGGLDKALLSNRVAMNRFTTSVQNSADSFFKSGFSEGLTELFNELATLVKENSALWESLGRIAGSVTKAITVLVSVLNPLLSVMGSILNAVTKSFGDFSFLVIPAFTALAYTLLPTSIREMTMLGKAVKTVAKAFKMAAAMRILFQAGIGIVALGAAEEISEFFAPTGKDMLLSSREEVADRFEKAGFNPYALGIKSFLSMPTPPQAQAPNINIKSELHVDGNMMADNVVSTATFGDSVNRHINSSNISSR